MKKNVLSVFMIIILLGAIVIAASTLKKDEEENPPQPTDQTSTYSVSSKELKLGNYLKKEIGESDLQGFLSSGKNGTFSGILEKPPAGSGYGTAKAIFTYDLERDQFYIRYKDFATNVQSVLEIDGELYYIECRIDDYYTTWQLVKNDKELSNKKVIKEWTDTSIITEPRLEFSKEENKLFLITNRVEYTKQDISAQSVTIYDVFDDCKVIFNSNYDGEQGEYIQEIWSLTIDRNYIYYAAFTKNDANKIYKYSRATGKKEIIFESSEDEFSFLVLKDTLVVILRGQNRLPLVEIYRDKEKIDEFTNAYNAYLTKISDESFMICDALEIKVYNTSKKSFIDVEDQLPKEGVYEYYSENVLLWNRYHEEFQLLTFSLEV